MLSGLILNLVQIDWFSLRDILLSDSNSVISYMCFMVDYFSFKSLIEMQLVVYETLDKHI